DLVVVVRNRLGNRAVRRRTRGLGIRVVGPLADEHIGLIMRLDVVDPDAAVSRPELPVALEIARRHAGHGLLDGVVAGGARFVVLDVPAFRVVGLGRTQRCRKDEQQHHEDSRSHRSSSRKSRTIAIWSAWISVGAWPTPAISTTFARGPRAVICATVSRVS